MTSDRAAVECFWQNPPFWGSRLENKIAEYWYGILLIFGLFFFGWGAWINHFYQLPNTLRNVATLLKDPFIASLGVALILSTIAFKSWQAQVKRTFSTSIQKGIIGDSEDSVHRFLEASKHFASRTNSRRRFILAGIAILITLFGNRDVIRHSLDPQYGSFRFYFLAAVSCFVFFSYAVGVVAWCLVCASLWIASLSDNILRIQPGHSDECCGLEEVGNCCLQSAIPLLIGMVLCLVWSNSRHIPFFKTYWEGWLEIIIPVAYVLMAILFGLACALVFLPVMRAAPAT